MNGLVWGGGGDQVSVAPVQCPVSREHNCLPVVQHYFIQSLLQSFYISILHLEAFMNEQHQHFQIYFGAHKNL